MRDMNNERLVVIDHGLKNIRNYADDYAVICVNVISTTTTAITAVEAGYRCFPVDTVARALSLADTMKAQLPVLAGDMHGTVPPGFEMSASPAAVARTNGLGRPFILFASAGTPVIREAGLGLAAFLACFRNMTATAISLVGRYRKIALIGGGLPGEFRQEDQLCCARIGEIIAESGFRLATRFTRDIIRRWKGAGLEDCLISPSVEHLRFAHQEADLDFILDHQDDLAAAHIMAEGEVIELPVPEIQLKSLSPHHHA